MGQIASPSQLRMSFLRWALVTVPLVILLGIASGQLSGSGYENPWFAELQKPDFMPAGWVFGVVWTALYALIGFALALILGARGARGRGLALMLFVIQMALNLAWSPLFFAAHQVAGALVVIALMFVAALATAIRFGMIRRLAGLLMVPYVLWLLFAAVLNYEIMRLNPGAETLVPGQGATQIQL
jgi:Tryptophan-rich sensory protein (mitochondrial benzodiazepine receptor homolog)